MCLSKIPYEVKREGKMPHILKQQSNIVLFKWLCRCSNFQPGFFKGTFKLLLFLYIQLNKKRDLKTIMLAKYDAKALLVAQR